MQRDSRGIEGYCTKWIRRTDPTYDGPFALVRAILADGPRALVPRFDGRACHNVDPHIFDATSEADVHTALAYCADCPARVMCRQWAQRQKRLSGVVAGQLWVLSQDGKTSRRDDHMSAADPGTTEQWVPVKDFPGYEISNSEQVKSLRRKITRSDGRIITVRERILKPVSHRYGHPHVTLYRGGRRTTVYPYLLAREAFLADHNWDEVN